MPYNEQRGRVAVGIDDQGWMFTNTDGDPVRPEAVSQAFDRIARRAGVPIIRLHDLRHTHGTVLIAAGVPVKVVSERLGHATPRSRSRPTSTSCPACKPGPRAPSRRSSHPGFYRARTDR